MNPRNWKWIVPAILSPFVLVCGYYVTQLQGDVACLAAPIFTAGLVLLWAGWKNYWAYFSTVEADNYATIKAADQPPEVLLFQAAQGMHPKAVEYLLLHRKKVLMIKKGTAFDARDWVDWVLEDAPIVHASFMIFFLQNSNQVQCMSKRLLSDGSKQLDPTGLVTDRQQYDAFTACLKKWLMITTPFGESQPPMWIPPYDPETVAKCLGLWHILYEDQRTAEPALPDANALAQQANQ